MADWLRTAWLRTAWIRAAAVFSKPRLDREFDEELETHLALATDEARRRGLAPEEARRQALLKLGGLEPTRELHRDTRGLPLVDALLQDLRYGARTLRKTPAFTLVVVASLALGIGANTAVFTLINAVVLRALPAVPDPAALVRLTAAPVLSFAMSQDLRAAQTVFTDIFGSSKEWPVRLTLPVATEGRATEGGATEAGATGAGATVVDNAPTLFVTASYFPVLGVRPQIGRFFTAADDRDPDSASARGSVLVISDAFWTRHFNRDPGVLGRIVYVNRSPCRLVGVAPRGFTGERAAAPVDAWVPLVPFSPRGLLEGRRVMFTATVGRLRPGVTQAQAERSITALYQRLLAAQWRAHPDTREWRTDPESAPRQRPVQEFTLRLVSAGTGLETYVRTTFARPLSIVMAIVALVLLIACANVANLLLARSTWRRRELGLRLALGCSRGRLVRQLLTESALLAALGAMAGLLLASWGSGVLAAMADAGPLDLRPDLRVLGFLVVVTALTGLAFGIAPALRAGRVDLTSALNEQGRGGAGRQVRQRLSGTLVMTQVALSLLLLVGAGLLVRSLDNLRQVDLGFRPELAAEQVVVFGIAKQQPQRRTPAEQVRVARELRDRVRQIPGVRSASVSQLLLFGGSDLYLPLQIDDYAPSREAPVHVHFNTVSGGYFETIGMTLLQGRTLEDSDDEAQAPVAVINQALARKYFPDTDPIDRTVAVALSGRPRTPTRIVGIVGDAKYNDLRTDVVPMIYFSNQQQPAAIRAIEVRTTEPIAGIAEAVRQAVMGVAPELMIERVASLSAQVDATLAAERLIATLGLAFGGIALLLASIGLYGVMAYGVARRTGEIGIRMALGATRARVLWLVLRQSLVVVLGGLAAGLVAARLATRAIEGFLYGLTPTDAGTIAGATMVLLGVAAVAAWLPARRATRVDPVTALRHE